MPGKRVTRKRVLGIVGSPRRGGNTDTLVGEVLRGAEEAGALVEKVILSELDIAPCAACNTCHETGRCAHQDDMLPLVEQMRRCPVWVLGTPVYWWGPTAQFKTFLDRWFGVERELFNGRAVILAVPLGGSADYARYTMEILTSVVDYLEMRLLATVLASGAYHPGAVRGQPGLLEEAYRFGREAARGFG